MYITFLNQYFTFILPYSKYLQNCVGIYLLYDYTNTRYNNVGSFCKLMFQKKTFLWRHNYNINKVRYYLCHNASVCFTVAEQARAVFQKWVTSRRSCAARGPASSTRSPTTSRPQQHHPQQPQGGPGQAYQLHWQGWVLNRAIVKSISWWTMSYCSYFVHWWTRRRHVGVRTI